MDDHIIDCCSLLNLYTGWGGLAELRELRRTWYVCEAVLNEAEYTREYGADGVPVLIPLDMRGLIQSGILHSARPETEAEIDDYVNFACVPGVNYPDRSASIILSGAIGRKSPVKSFWICPVS